MNLLQGPGTALVLLVTLTVLATAVMSAVEVSQLGVGETSEKAASGTRRSGPVAWFLFVALLWPIGYPAYLFHRSRYGARNLLAPGVVGAVVFVGSTWAIHATIQDAKAEVLRRLESVFASPNLSRDRIRVPGAASEQARGRAPSSKHPTAPIPPARFAVMTLDDAAAWEYEDGRLWVGNLRLDKRNSYEAFHSIRLNATNKTDASVRLVAYAVLLDAGQARFSWAG